MRSLLLPATLWTASVPGSNLLAWIRIGFRNLPTSSGYNSMLRRLRLKVFCMQSITIMSIRSPGSRISGVTSKYISRIIVHAQSSALKRRSRYRVPAHVQKHVDYITPGLKLLTPSKSKSASERSEIEKRTFGVTAPNHPILPPKMKAMPDSLANLLKMPLIAVCNVAVLPFCIQSEL